MLSSLVEIGLAAVEIHHVTSDDHMIQRTTDLFIFGGYLS